MPSFAEMMLDQQNEMRKIHGAQPLKLSAELNSKAQSHAERSQRNNKMEHDSNSKYGENLFSLMSQPPLPEESVVKRAVEAWYGEIKEFKFGKEPKDAKCGHFTQMIWKGTQELGVGYVSDKGKVYVVCVYNPPGNFLGKFTENVSPKVR